MEREKERERKGGIYREIEVRGWRKRYKGIRGSEEQKMR